MQMPGDDPLAGTVLTGNEYVRIRRTDAVNELQHRLHRSGIGNELRRVLLEELVLALEPVSATKRLAELDLSPQNAEKTRVVPRLLHEVARAGTHRLERELDAPPRGHDHDRKRVVDVVQSLEQVETLATRSRVACVVQVHQQQIEVLAFDRFDDGIRIVDRFGAVAFCFQQEPQRFAHVGLVVGNEDPWTHAAHVHVNFSRPTRPSA